MSVALLQGPGSSFVAHNSPVQSLAFGAGGDLLATGDTERNLAVWKGGEQTMAVSLHSKNEKLWGIERIHGLSFSPDGQRLTAACGDTLTTFDLASGRQLWAYQPPRSWGFLIISPITLSISGHGTVAVATDAGRLTLFDPEGRLLANWWDNDSPRQVAFINDRLIGTDSFSICIWDNAGRKLGKKKLKERAFGMAASPDGKRVCVRSIRSVEELDPETLETINTYPTHYGLPLVDWSPDGTHLAVTDLREVVVYLQGNGEVARLQTNGAVIKSVRFSPNGEHLAAGCSDGSVCIWNLKE